ESTKRWKMKWFVLQEEELVYHHKKDKSLVIGLIPLSGASVVCPVGEPEFNGQGMFKLNSRGGEELYFEAAGKQDRDGWAHAIGAVIRSLSVSKQDSHHNVPFKSFRAYANVSEILGAMQDPDAGVNLNNHVRNGAVHKNCFKGSEVVDWLIRWSIVRKREDGAAMIQTLLKLGHVQEVDINDGAIGASRHFNDGDKLYRFSSLNLGVKRNSFYDSTDSESSASEDEDEDGQTDLRIRKGKSVKSAFLLKKKNIRNDWRIVRLILRENPPTMEYSKAISTAFEGKAAKIIDLNQVVVEETKPECLACSQEGLGKVKPKRKIVLRDRKGRCYTFKAKDEAERYLGVSSAVTSVNKPEQETTAICNQYPQLVTEQKQVCARNPRSLLCVTEGAKKAIYECQHQFKTERWNCTLSANYSVFGHFLTKGTRETAFIYAILSAGVVHSVTRACTAGNLTDCTCDMRRHGEGTVEGWKWGGCSDNIQYGISFSRKFVDAPETISHQSTFNIRNKMNLHNNEVGREMVRDTMKLKCRCHGVSGSCEIQTCWKSLANFRTVGNKIKEKYERSARIRRKSLRRLRRLEKTKRRVPIDKQELVFVHKSPNYCRSNPRKGILGTRGRECNKTSTGSDSCDLLCCGRGYNTQIVRYVERCHCKFIWCCYVECKTCETLLDKHTCK
ncbi:hypothetical protein FSP39_004536, partial [Pinctada imbricata]